MQDSSETVSTQKYRCGAEGCGFILYSETPLPQDSHHGTVVHADGSQTPWFAHSDKCIQAAFLGAKGTTAKVTRTRRPRRKREDQVTAADASAA